MHKEVKAFIRTFSITFPIAVVLVLTYGYFNGIFDSEISESKISNGCTDSTALNYNPEANTDDGSCMNELDVAYEFIKKNLKDPYSAQFESGGSWDLPSFQSKYPCIKVKYIDVRAKNSFGAYNLERYYVSFKDNEVIPELIEDNNQSDGEIGNMLEIMCIIHEIECNQQK